MATDNDMLDDFDDLNEGDYYAQVENEEDVETPEENGEEQKEGAGAGDKDEWFEDHEIFGQGVRLKKNLEPVAKAFKDFNTKYTSFNQYEDERRGQLREYEVMLNSDTDLIVADRLLKFELEKLKKIDISKIEDTDDKLAYYERLKAVEEEQTKLGSQLQAFAQKKHELLNSKLNDADAGMSQQFKDDWNDAAREGIIKFAQVSGFNRGELLAVLSDKRALPMLYKAYMYDSLTANENGASKQNEEKVKPAKLVTRMVRKVSNSGTGQRSVDDMPIDEYIRLKNAQELGIDLD